MRYVYSVVRFVPDPARGEFINVGAIVGSDDSREWDLRQVGNTSRARQLDDRHALPGALRFLDDVGHQVDLFWDLEVEPSDEPRESQISEAWLASLAGNMRNVVQLTPPIPLAADSVDDAMAFVVDEMLVDPMSEGLDYRRRTRAQSALRSAYIDANLTRGSTFFEKVRLNSEGVSERLDFVVANGKPVQLAQAWSFEIPKQEDLARRIRAWGWTISKLRERGGQLQFDGRPATEIASDIDLEVVYVPPTPELADEPAFREAQIVFADVGATSVSIDRVDQISRRAAELVAA